MQYAKIKPKIIWCIKTYTIAYIKIQKIRFTIHYVKPTAQRCHFTNSTIVSPSISDLSGAWYSRNNENCSRHLSFIETTTHQIFVIIGPCNFLWKQQQQICFTWASSFLLANIQSRVFIIRSFNHTDVGHFCTPKYLNISISVSVCSMAQINRKKKVVTLTALSSLKSLKASKTTSF